MEGTLFKWTNYYNGWQPRYFVLSQNGILSYYKSSQLVNEGCKGSFLVLACEVKVHPHDLLRFDLIIPGEQFFCLKAKTQSERQNWLVALGSFKSRGIKSSTIPISTSTNNASQSNLSNLNINDQELKLKVQELRLYETVLMQSIHAIKSNMNDTTTPDVQKIDETISMLNVTCDAFIHTLDECVKLATGNRHQSLLFSSSTSSMDNKSCDELSSIKRTSNPMATLPKQIVYRTFFSELRYTFFNLVSLKFNEIHSDSFLLTCEQYLQLIEKLNSTAFTPFYSDTLDKIEKLRKIITVDPNKFRTFHSIINEEIVNQTKEDSKSATNALLWLKRNIDFLRCFLYEFGQGDKTIEEAMNKSYGQILKRFHGWKTRGLYSKMFQSVSDNEKFLQSLAIDQNDARESLFERQVLNEMVEHSTNMNTVLNKINDFYNKNKLESVDVID